MTKAEKETMAKWLSDTIAKAPSQQAMIFLAYVKDGRIVRAHHVKDFPTLDLPGEQETIDGILQGMIPDNDAD